MAGLFDFNPIPVPGKVSPSLGPSDISHWYARPALWEDPRPIQTASIVTRVAEPAYLKPRRATDANYAATGFER